MKLTRAAEMRPASFDEAQNTVEVVWTTGAAVRRYDWRSGRYYQEILEVSPKAVRLDHLNAGAPLLDTHDDSALAQVVGAVVPGSAKIADGVGIARVKLSSAAADADIVSKIRDGIIRTSLSATPSTRSSRPTPMATALMMNGVSSIGSRLSFRQCRSQRMLGRNSARSDRTTVRRRHEHA